MKPLHCASTQRTIFCASTQRTVFCASLLALSPSPRVNRSIWSHTFWSHTRSSLSQMAPKVQYSTSVEEMQDVIKSSKRILAVCGAGLSVASGLPTFRGDGGLWRNHEPTTLADPDAFEDNPGLVWLFYAWRRHLALTAKPNDGHFALAELAKKKDEFLVLSQNVDGEPYFVFNYSIVSSRLCFLTLTHAAG